MSRRASPSARTDEGSAGKRSGPAASGVPELVGYAHDADARACRPGPLIGHLSREDANELALLLKAVADPARLQIVALLRSAEAGELCACDFPAALQLSQPTVSHHLKVLVEAGLAARRTEGTWAHFRLVHHRLAEISELLR